jgi:hypothetical protein
VGYKAVGIWHCLKSLNPDRITAVTGTRTFVGVWRIHVAEGEFTVILLTIDNAGEGTGSEMAEADNPFGSNSASRVFCFCKSFRINIFS